MDPCEDENEKEHFQKIVWTFENYRDYSLERLQRTEDYFESLPVAHKNLLSKYKDNFQVLRNCIEDNYSVIKSIIKDVSSMFENFGLSENGVDTKNKDLIPSSSEIEKVQVTLKQLTRDWSEEGKKERNASYQPIIQEIKRQFPSGKCDTSSIKVLVPGAGLGRLAFEIARLGYTCHGNEFSGYMLITSNYVLNKCYQENQHVIYPWLYQSENNVLSSHQTARVTFPDVNPRDTMQNNQFLMIAGDFLQVYKQEAEWDCVATCFFIDCAHNIVSFIETIYHILKPGGVWINLGPLLYHFSNGFLPDSIEPSYEIVKEVILGFGFVFEVNLTIFS
nr:PREDICTED: carnosine N-methyltransferase-like [Bemisia tabaci]